MKIFKNKIKMINIIKLILEELKDMHDDISEIREYVQTSNWDSLSKDNDIKKLKEKNKELRRQVKEMKNDNRRETSIRKK